MKNFAWMGLVLCAVLALSGCSPSHDGYRIEEGMLVFDTPAREPGQRSVLGLAVEPIPVVRVGFIGLGMRGPGAVERFTHLDSVRIVALCDLYPERATAAQQLLAERGLPAAAEYSGEEGWKELCERDDIDLVYICTPWQLHVPMAVYAMEHGKHVAVEVPAATSLEECWQLVNTAEKTQRHCMMLENCVYDFFELTTLNMAQHGLFGELLEAEGAYIHNLEPFWDYYQGNWRLEFNRTHRGDVYATHGLGPVCQLFDIHRGDRMRYLVAMDTPSVNGRELAREKMGTDSFANGDHTLTLIKTERGRVIHLQHNVYTPRPYSRMYAVTGTEGYASKYPVEGYAFRPELVPARCGARGADAALRAPYRGRNRRKGEAGGRPRRHGLHHGLPAGLLPAPRAAARPGCLRCGRVVVHRGADRRLARAGQHAGGRARLHARRLEQGRRLPPRHGRVGWRAAARGGRRCAAPGGVPAMEPERSAECCPEGVGGDAARVGGGVLPGIFSAAGGSV